ncbi:MAG: DUF6029 family protein [Porphyromonas sp.]|nr:DUF6029 family protein [Porphyromonas sp.]
MRLKTTFMASLALLPAALMATSTDSVPSALLTPPPTPAIVATQSSATSPLFKKPEAWRPFSAQFSVQSDMLFSLADDADKKAWLGNSYITATLRNNYLEFGTRFEELSNPLPGRKDERGRGIPHFYLSGRYGSLAEVTLGDFYEQFGSGILLRSYEERTLGIDNAIRGAKVVLNPYNGVYIKGLTGQQRYYFDRTFQFFNANRGYVSGADLELNIDRWSKAMQKQRIGLSLGASVVSKYEAQEDILLSRDGVAYRLNLPKQVPAFGGRMRLSLGDLVFSGEYAYKGNDPTASNGYIYKPGSVAMFSTSYSQKGLSFLLQAKRSENFNLLSKRSMLGNPLHINHLPAFTNTHTYALAALHPYATQPDGEWALQGEFRYNFKRKTFLGGKYGTGIKLNYSHVRGLKKNWLEGVDPANSASLMGTDGYTAPFFGMGELYFSDFDVEITKKLSKDFSFIFSYMHQIYNQRVVEGHAINNDLVWSNIFILDAKYRFNNKVSLRTELQYLNSRQAEGDWWYGMAELSLLPNFMFSISDQYNSTMTKEHYYMASATYSKGSHRFSLAYGRTRAGMNCSGGVCRWMPQTKGFYFSYSANF